MRHQVQNCRRFAGGTVYRLPDGRRLVSEFNQPAKLIDAEGTEMAPSPSEVAALIAITVMAFPRKNTHGKKLLRMECA
jgi:hypothetical protein